MDERQFYTEKQETKNLNLTCPACRKEDSYPVRWVDAHEEKRVAPRRRRRKTRSTSPRLVPIWSAWMSLSPAGNAGSALNLQVKAWC